MNERAIKRASAGLLALDVALLLLGLLVLLMVLKLLRFDDLNPLYNAWTYLLGVPTVLIAISMLTRVVANDAVEKSIQVGFLISVAMHLMLIFFALNLVLFRSAWPVEVDTVAVTARANQVRSPQYHEPSSTSAVSRPDYLKPVPTQPNTEVSEVNLSRQREEAAKLSVDIAKDEVKPTLMDKPLKEPRKEVALSQPTIKSTAEKLDRPDLSQPIQRSLSSAEIPSAGLSRPIPEQRLQAASTDMNRSESMSPSTQGSLSPTLDNSLKFEGQPQRFVEREVPEKKLDLDNTNRALEKALDRTVNDSRMRPNSTSQGTRQTADLDKPSVSNVPIPQIGVRSESAVDLPTERDTRMQSRANEAGSNARPSLETPSLRSLPGLEPSMNGISSNGPRASQSSMPSEAAFLSDSRFASDVKQGAGRPASDGGGTSTAPATSQPVPVGKGALASSETGGTPTDVMSELSKNGRAELSERRSNASSKGTGNVDSNLSPTIGNPSLDTLSDRWAGSALDIPRKGLDSVKHDMVLPELKDAELAKDRMKRPEAGLAHLAPSTVPIPAPAFSQRLKRNREMQEESAPELGPLGPQTEEAIERGLQFLAKYQRPDGSWHLEDFGERVDIRSESAATALALLSFQGAGYTHKQFKYEGVCNKALKWLAKNQRPNGDLYVRTDAKSDSNAWLYSHAIATLAICETYGMTKDEEIKDNAQRAIDFLVSSQDPQGGGWRYQPRIGSDTSVTGWCMMALKSAELSGLKVPKESYQGITKWLAGSQASEQQKFLYRYNWQAADTPATKHGRVPTPVMTSVGLLMRLYLGWRRDNPDMSMGADWLLRSLPAEGTAVNPQRDTYYWYYSTQVMFHMGGERWNAWYRNLYPMLIRTQKNESEYAGSWDPNGRIPDAWGRFGGRLYVTTLNLLSLEVYYRHLPIYEATAD